MGLAKRMLQEDEDAAALECSECGTENAYNPQAYYGEPKVRCDCGTFDWWCEQCQVGYSDDCCDRCLQRSVEAAE